MEQGSSSGAPNENGNASSIVPTSTARARHPRIRLNVQTLRIPSVADFLRRIHQNLYRVLRILVSQVQISRFRNVYNGIRASQYRSLEKLRRVRNRITEALENYNSLKVDLDETWDSVTLLWQDFLRISTARKEAQTDSMNAVNRLFRLKRNLAMLNHTSSFRTYRKLRLRQLIVKAGISLAKIGLKKSNLDRLFWKKHKIYRDAYNEYKNTEKEFQEKFGLSSHLNLRRALHQASEEFDREHRIQEEQLYDLRRALQNLRREHRMGILRSVPLLQLNNQQEAVSPGTSENVREWQNLIFFRVDVVIEITTVTRRYY